MRLLLAAGAPGAEDLAAALIGAPTLDIVGVAHPSAEACARLSDQGRTVAAPDLAALHAQTDAEAIVLTAADAIGTAAGTGLPCAVFTSAVEGATGLSALQAAGDSSIRVLAPALHRTPHSLLRESLDTGRIGSPPSMIFTAGRRRPSWKISVASPVSDPGAIPPTSE